MYQISDIVVYRRQLCRIAGKMSHETTGEMCYVLVPFHSVDQSMRMVVPVSNRGGHLREVLKKEEVFRLLEEARNLQVDTSLRTNMKSRYLQWLNSEDPLDLFRIIKTALLNNRARMLQRRTPASVDKEFLERAEVLLGEEVSLVLGMRVEDTLVYLRNELMKED